MTISVFRFFKLLIPAFCFLGMAASPLYAWSTINGVAICTVANVPQYYYGYPEIASDGSGGAIITWMDYRDGSTYNIYSQRVNSQGSTLWTPNGVAICTAVNSQYGPVIVSDESGGAIITWYDERTSNPGTYAQRVNSQGSTLWMTNGVAICTVAGGGGAPQMASDGSGGAILTWQDTRRTFFYDIYAQRVDSNGSTRWTTSGVPICVSGTSEQYPTIASDELGGAIITWEAGDNIGAQRVNSNGSTLWVTNGVTVSTSTEYQEYPVIVSDGESGAIITWQSYRNDNYWEVYVQQVDSTGSALWTPNGVAVCTVSTYQLSPIIASDGQDGAIITWEDTRNGPNNLYAQRVNSTGSTLWTLNAIAICTAANGQGFPTIVSDGLGGAIITWQDYRDGSTYNIYAQRVDSTGSTLWVTNGVAICTAVNNQYSPVIVTDGSDGAIITWEDGRNGSTYNIYAQRVNENGSVPVEDWYLYDGDIKRKF